MPDSPRPNPPQRDQRPKIEPTADVPLADRNGATDAQLDRIREAGINTDSRGGPGSATEAGRQNTDPAPESGLIDRGSSEPRAATRIGKHSSQGLAGAQGSGGGAERGIEHEPSAPASPVTDAEGAMPGFPRSEQR